MYNSPYYNPYNSQMTVDRINNQMAELEKLKEQLQKPMQPATPTNLTQNFQLAPNTRDVIRYASSIDEVQRDMVIGDTPYFSKDMSVVWIKNIKGEIRSYELREIVQKDEKDLKIDYLMAQIEELKKGIINNEPDANVNDTITNADKEQKPANVTAISKSNAKSK